MCAISNVLRSIHIEKSTSEFYSHCFDVKYLNSGEAKVRKRLLHENLDTCKVFVNKLKLL